MTFTAYQNGVRSFFDTGMQTASPNTKMYWEGSTEGPQLPGSTTVVDDPQPGDDAWLRFNLQSVTNPEISPGFTRHHGAAIVSCFSTVKPGGNEAAEALAEAVAGVFRREDTLSGMLEFGRVEVKEIGPDGEGWYQVNVRAEFQYHANE